MVCNFNIQVFISTQKFAPLTVAANVSCLSEIGLILPLLVHLCKSRDRKWQTIWSLDGLDRLSVLSISSPPFSHLPSFSSAPISWNERKARSSLMGHAPRRQVRLLSSPRMPVYVPCPRNSIPASWMCSNEQVFAQNSRTWTKVVFPSMYRHEKMG